ncbi:MAG: HDIG domain-containing protein [Candidatus Omnitrophica bacterium]|nr:HDIG domain-containing protein [Candidatus Omnitrophota bacterium]
MTFRMLDSQKAGKFFRDERTISVLMILLFVAVSFSCILFNPELFERSAKAGDIAGKDFYGPYEFTYEWDADKEKTRKAQEDVLAKLPYFLVRDVTAESAVSDKVKIFLSLIGDLSSQALTPQEKAAKLSAEFNTGLVEKNYQELFAYPNKEELTKNVLGVLDKVYLIGLVSDNDQKFLQSKGYSKVILVDKTAGGETLLEKNTLDLKKMSDLDVFLDNISRNYFPDDKKVRHTINIALKYFFTPNLVLDDKRAEIERTKTLAAVKPVLKTWTVKKNEIIVQKGGRINERHVAALAKMNEFSGKSKNMAFFVGIFQLFIVLGVFGAIYLKFTRSESMILGLKELSIILTGVLLMIVGSNIVLQLSQPVYFVPMAALGMAIIMLSGFNLAFLGVLTASMLVAVLAGGKIDIFLVLISGSMVGMLVVRDARRRSTILWAGFMAGLAEFAVIICIGFINGTEAQVFVGEGLWGLFAGIFSGVFTMGFLPIFEFLFRVPTNINLLELSDLNHPLLKRLAMEAPGTYQHSIMVGNLAEAACESIGANSLLTRVGAYYHDIGKLAKPEYFGENEMGTKSKHTALTPSMSALIIANHVKEGLELAGEYKLNRKIRDFIEQHHGNSLIAYFYQKAIEKNKDNEEEIKEEHFRYVAPKPQTKEAAIILLADSVEASSRALDDPTPASITNLVKKVINNKFIDGQLDECYLTLKDMHKIADAFVRVLMAIFHTRTTYPDDENKSEEENGNAKEKNGNGYKNRKLESR